MKTGIHRWRYTLAKMWILQGGDVFRLQKILGLSSLDVIKEYIEMFSDDLKKDFNLFNPLEQVECNNRDYKNGEIRCALFYESIIYSIRSLLFQ